MSEFELRRALRGLDTGRDPGRDLWPGIAARLHDAAAVPPASPRQAHRWPMLLALAASLVLAVLLALPLTPTPDRSQAGPSMAGAPTAPVEASAAGPGAASSPLQVQADALTMEYVAALGQLDARQAPPALAPTLEELDSSAQTIREALRQDPQADFLLGQLQRTYARRLRLTQLAVTG